MHHRHLLRLAGLHGEALRHDYATTNGLAANINLKVEQGTGSTGADCAGFTAAGSAIFDGTLTSFATTKTSFATGAGTWAPTGSGHADQVLPRHLHAERQHARTRAQGGTARLGLTWEAQNS